MESTIPRVPLKWLGVGHIIASLNCIAIVWSIGPVRRSRPLLGSKGGTVVRALASHQCGLGSNPGVNAICVLSLLLVLSLAPRGFSPGTPVFPCPQKPTFPNSTSTRNQVDKEPLCVCGTCKSLFISLFYLFILL